ncbi:MAG: class I SAM-dependent methyltransferase, partial [Halobacteria archaeon]|nr:class I SAM-dependent methyltransferase [Halobacteria archaeon]
MPITQPFDEHTQRYEDWFDEHDYEYTSELEAVRSLLPSRGVGVEIGIGSGQFAVPLGVEYGIDPSDEMMKVAREKDDEIHLVKGVAEHLPFRETVFDYALIVTTICFVDDIPTTLAEARRVLDDGS